MNSQQDRMEAAAWVAKLHGQDRGPELEAGFRRWLNESEDHRSAFDMANEVWGDLSTIPKADHPIRVQFKTSRALNRIRRPALALAASLLIAIALMFVWQLQPQALTTKVGQVRELMLEDGTRATLNTDTRLRVRYDEHRRYVELSRGEALFEVAKDAARPFSVALSGREVTALGTSFLVRSDGDRSAVTLIEGKVAVSGAPDVQPVVLGPGERLTFVGDQNPSVDTPPIERMTAWKRRQVSLDHNTLVEAVAEMNRYSKLQIEVEGSGASNVLITGIFRAGDSDEFAHAVADTYGLDLRVAGGKLILSGPR